MKDVKPQEQALECRDRFHDFYIHLPLCCFHFPTWRSWWDASRLQHNTGWSRTSVEENCISSVKNFLTESLDASSLLVRRLDSSRLRKALDELQARHDRLRAKLHISACGKASGALGTVESPLCNLPLKTCTFHGSKWSLSLRGSIYQLDNVTMWQKVIGGACWLSIMSHYLGTSRSIGWSSFSPFNGHFEAMPTYITFQTLLEVLTGAPASRAVLPAERRHADPASRNWWSWSRPQPGETLVYTILIRTDTNHIWQYLP